MIKPKRPDCKGCTKRLEIMERTGRNCHSELCPDGYLEWRKYLDGVAQLRAAAHDTYKTTYTYDRSCNNKIMKRSHGKKNEN